MRRALALLLVVLAPALYAERVRVIVAVAQGEVTLQSGVITSLRTASRVERWGKGPAFATEIDASELEELRRDPRVRAISLDTGGGGALLESIPLIGADVLHVQGFDGRGITVAILDTGIDHNHADFAGRIVGEQCFCDNFDGTGCCPGGNVQGNLAEDDNGHGTHVAGIAAGGGNDAPVGVASQAWIVAVKVMDAQNRFRGFTQIYQGLEWIADHRPDVDVINMSLGSDARLAPEQCDVSAVAMGLAPVIHQLRARGVLITASTGNDGDSHALEVPACMTDVVAVGATYDSPGAHCLGTSTTADDIACFANSSASMDIVAPGVAITSARRGGGTVVYNGTSMAAPHVAGTIALMKQAGGAALSADFIQQTLEQTGVPVTDPRNSLTFPRLNALAAVSATPRAPVPPKRRASRH